MRPHMGSDFVSHEPCEECGSSDGNCLYSDGHLYCQVCESYTPPPKDGEDERQSSSQTQEKSFSPIIGEYKDLPSRKITQETCKKYGYTVGRHYGKAVQICNVYDENGVLTGQKLRDKDKNFVALGKITSGQLIGRHLFNGGKRLVITEGEIDMLSMSQVQGNKFPVVSLASGSKSAKRAIASNLDWIQNFQEVVLCFDNDEAGRKAVQEAAELLAGFVTVLDMKLPLKDANDMLVAGRVDELLSAFWSAEKYRPDGLVTIADLKERIRQKRNPEKGLPYWDDRLNEVLFGRHWGQLILLGAGTGVGKTDWITQQMEHDTHVLGHEVCGYLLEQDPEETMVRLMGKLGHRAFHVPDGNWTEEEFDQALDNPALEKLELYDNFGIASWDNLHSKLLYQVSQGKRIFYIDHLTALATGSDERNEKEELEYVCAELASFCKRHKVIVHAISHLTTPERGKSHEEGGRVTIRQFKGSRAIGFWAHIMIGLERNQQADSLEERQTTTLRILKDRFTGRGTGTTYLMGYLQDEARLYPKAEDSEGDDSCPFDQQEDAPSDF